MGLPGRLDSSRAGQRGHDPEGSGCALFKDPGVVWAVTLRPFPRISDPRLRAADVAAAGALLVFAVFLIVFPLLSGRQERELVRGPKGRGAR